MGNYRLCCRLAGALDPVATAPARLALTCRSDAGRMELRWAAIHFGAGGVNSKPCCARAWECVEGEDGPLEEDSR